MIDTSPAAFGSAFVGLFMATCLPVQAESAAGEEDASIWAFGTLQVENDLFANIANTDRHYTNDLQAAVLSEEITLDGWLREIATARILFGAPGWRAASSVISGSMTLGFAF